MFVYLDRCKRENTECKDLDLYRVRYRYFTLVVKCGRNVRRVPQACRARVLFVHKPVPMVVVPHKRPAMVAMRELSCPSRDHEMGSTFGWATGRCAFCFSELARKASRRSNSTRSPNCSEPIAACRSM